MRHLTIVLFFLLTACTLSGQDIRKVQLLEEGTALPVSGAFYTLDTLQFGVSDAEGMIRLTLVKGKENVLVISHLSYGDTLVYAAQLERGINKLYLTTATVELPEVSISGKVRHKFRDPAQLVKMALKRVPDNYPAQETERTALYREVIAYDDCPVNVAEALMEIYTSSYAEKFRMKQAFSEGWDRYYASYRVPKSGKGKYLGVRFPEGTQQYAAVNDRYRVLQSRYSLNEAPHDFYVRFWDGVLHLVALDKVRLGYDYLDPGRMKKYTYSLIDSVIVNGAYCFHLRFQPADEEPTRYFDLSSQQTTGVFSGDLYIDQQSLAIVRFQAENAKAVVKNFDLNRSMTARKNSMHTEVNYQRSSDGKWQLAEVVSRVTSSFDSSYQAVRTLYLSDDELELRPAGVDRWRFHSFQWNLQNLTRSYHPEFWDVFQKTSFYQRGKLIEFDCPQEGQPGEAAFAAPFLVDTVAIPRANPLRTNDYVKEKQIRNAWEWLENPEDSATTAYLKWENDYYNQFFRQRPELLEDVAEQFSGKNQGRPARTENMAVAVTDTVPVTQSGRPGFYRVGPNGDSTLLAATDPATPGLVLTDYGWTDSRTYYYTLTDDRTYDRLITIYSAKKKQTDRNRIDDFVWRGDTLYVTENDNLLRTHQLSRWTDGRGWETLLREADPGAEFRLQVIPTGELIVISESLTTAFVFRQTPSGWQKEPTAYPAMAAGSGPRGRGCRADIKADYLADCRENSRGSCVLAVNSARYEIWIRPAGAERWERIAMPEGQLNAKFVPVAGSDDIHLRMEGVAAYGKKFSVDFSAKRLVPVATNIPPTELSGYRDSIVWVASTGGERIPCQVRWKTSWQDSLRGTQLKVYAAYGNSYLIGHSETDIALMNLGYAVVYVHARGGGVRGPAWYDAGRAANKLTACKDYLAAVRYFASPGHPLAPTPVFGYAQSAGGPVLGYAVNEAPQLFAAAVFDYAYLDVAGTMSRPELPLTVYEYPEWGNPADKTIREQQSRYSPYQNIRPQMYPPLLFLAGRYDQSTPYWQVAKFVAALRAVESGNNPVLFYTALRGSHPGTPFGPGFDKLVEQVAFLEVAARK